MKTITLHAMALFLGIFAATSSPAQEITFGASSSGSSDVTLGSGDFTTQNGTAWLTLSKTSNYYANVGMELNLPSSVLDSAGWIFNTSAGSLVITDTNSDSAADPFVAYGDYFVNTTGAESTFSMTFSSSFAPVYDGNLVRATSGLSLTDGTPDGSGVSANVMQTSELIGPGSPGGTSTGITLNSPVEFASDSNTVTNRQTSSAYPNYNTGPGGGPYDELTVTVSGSYSPDAILVVSGRVDAIPEPSGFALLAVSGLGALLFHLQRMLRAS